MQWIASVVLALAFQSPALASAIPVIRPQPTKIDRTIVGRIVRIFHDRGWEIDRRTASECWRQHAHALDIADSEPFPELPDPDTVFMLVTAYEKVVRRGMETHLVRLP